MTTRCRLCTANDEGALIEELAADLWRNEADGRTFDAAGDYWQEKFREFARRSIATMRHWHDA